MLDGHIRTPLPENEPVREYAPASHERTTLKEELDRRMDTRMEIPVRIDGKDIHTGRLFECRAPHDHSHVLGELHEAGPDEVDAAIASALAAQADWARMPWENRAAIFLKAADLLAGPYRDAVNATTMLGQSKTVFQAEIDAACELIDFWRYNVSFAEQLYHEQPESAPGIWNYVDHRPLEGFVFAVTPFNFTSIGANLATAPVLMGNVALWKPAETSTYGARVLLELLDEAGLPPGVINMLPGKGAEIGPRVLSHPELAGVHFTGSTPTFQAMWRHIGENISSYRSYPRIVGETGGKDFIFAHPSADPAALVTGMVRGAFEFQGQKCSAASRAFIPASLWDDVCERLDAEVSSIRMGSPRDFRNFMCAVINARSYEKITGYIDYARSAPDHEVLIGGGASDEEGYFIEPTVVVADNARARLMCEEIFGPVLTLCRYEDNDMDAAMQACDEASPYALTGAIFCRERTEIVRMMDRLRFAAGNFYINDKPTGAVVGQQPFGGGRASGTNDKAGSVLNLQRWVSPRSVKETFVPATDYRYPHMGER